ncbi:MAG TPA: hypothetical protein VJB99_00160 [Patescibacteria group bacterium]|nr:hypothetical protein [Patescibacteria group bacterium]
MKRETDGTGIAGRHYATTCPDGQGLGGEAGFHAGFTASGEGNEAHFSHDDVTGSYEGHAPIQGQFAPSNFIGSMMV